MAPVPSMYDHSNDNQPSVSNISAVHMELSASDNEANKSTTDDTNQCSNESESETDESTVEDEAVDSTTANSSRIQRVVAEYREPSSA